MNRKKDTLRTDIPLHDPEDTTRIKKENKREKKI